MELTCQLIIWKGLKEAESDCVDQLWVFHSCYTRRVTEDKFTRFRAEAARTQ
jgi:hypothetical protein